MERLDNIHIFKFSQAGFENYPLWVWDDEMEGFNPLSGNDGDREKYGPAFIKADFFTEHHTIPGYWLDGGCVFGLFWNDKEYIFNKNLEQENTDQSKILAGELGDSLSHMQGRLFTGEVIDMECFFENR